jgi:hypothetical protein
MSGTVGAWGLKLGLGRLGRVEEGGRIGGGLVTQRQGGEAREGGEGGRRKGSRGPGGGGGPRCHVWPAVAGDSDNHDAGAGPG